MTIGSPDLFSFDETGQSLSRIYTNVLAPNVQTPYAFENDIPEFIVLRTFQTENFINNINIKLNLNTEEL
jgi:hypothetical protein